MEARSVAVLALVVLVSGCAHTAPSGSGSSSGKGLEIAELSVADSQLTPGQETRVRLKLRNHHTEPISIDEISLYNTGFLQVSGKSCTPSSIKQARKDFSPEMSCSWIVKAPEELEGFESKAITMKLRLAYSSKISNEQEPMKVSFKQLSDIEARKNVERTFSNGEVSVKVGYENPVPVEGGIVDFELAPAGNGRVASDYSMSYRPESVFDCPEQVSKERKGTARFSCNMVSESTAVRNLVFSTSYKYIKSPSLDIEVARP